MSESVPSIPSSQHDPAVAGTKARRSLLPAARSALDSARWYLRTAHQAPDPSTRFLHAHFAALRAAAAVVAQCGHRTRRKRQRPRSVWELLPEAEPSLDGWALRFSASAAQRPAVEAGLPSALNPGAATELMNDATTFLAVVEDVLRSSVSVPDGSVEHGA
ncbi:SAV_6107 family HEPN domain-containing protein [Lipingzhangella sp. LS1_29]|uniref:SAV_6107 family HEPN domain-containing protein n=1 Tax=Lipingzhangella rawalii TaxID=2055835 RepID=A0ABU2H2G1_9ACTN|nr:SAV_6107 family HEPN domain-containing protein [Lipingzhangella rawalii]MDS1269476.1 SAV_6107 family HEPN domain-containing protein [Lipingzhangella rawalii]